MARTILERLLDIEREQEASGSNIPGTAGIMLGGLDATQEPIPYFSELDQQQRADAVNVGLRMVPENILSLPGFAVDAVTAAPKYAFQKGLEAAGYDQAAKDISYFPLTEKMQEGVRQGVNYVFGEPPQLTDERQLPAIMETAMVADPLSWIQYAPAAKTATSDAVRKAVRPFQEGGTFNPKRVEGVVESPRVRLLEQQPEQAQLTAPVPEEEIQKFILTGDQPKPAPTSEIPDKPLVASTFVQPEAIRLFAESGGSPAPSIGITRADAAPEILSKFGDVQLIVSPERLRQGNYRIYGDDAYLGRAPELSESYEPMDVALAMANDPDFARYKTEIPQFIQDFMAFDAQRLGVNTEGVRQDALSRAVKVIQQSADYDRPLPDVAQAVINYRPKDHLSSPGLRAVDAESRFVEMESGLPYDAEAALDKMMGRDAQMRGSEFGATQKHTPFQNLFAREFENLDEAAANRDVLRGPGEPRIPKSEAQSDEFADLMARISTDFLGGEFRTKTVGRDILEGRNIDEMLQKYNMKPEGIKTIKDKITNLQEKYKNQPKNYFEAKGDEVIKLEDFDAVVIDEMYTDAIKILEDAGVKKILTYGTPKERAEIFKKYPELLFSLMLVGLTGSQLMGGSQDGATNNTY